MPRDFFDTDNSAEPARRKPVTDPQSATGIFGPASNSPELDPWPYKPFDTASLGEDLPPSQTQEDSYFPTGRSSGARPEAPPERVMPPVREIVIRPAGSKDSDRLVSPPSPQPSDRTYSQVWNGMENKTSSGTPSRAGEPGEFTRILQTLREPTGLTNTSHTDSGALRETPKIENSKGEQASPSFTQLFQSLSTETLNKPESAAQNSTSYAPKAAAEQPAKDPLSPSNASPGSFTQFLDSLATSSQAGTAPTEPARRTNSQPLSSTEASQVRGQTRRRPETFDSPRDQPTRPLAEQSTQEQLTSKSSHDQETKLFAPHQSGDTGRSDIRSGTPYIATPERNEKLQGLPASRPLPESAASRIPDLTQNNRVSLSASDLQAPSPKLPGWMPVLLISNTCLLVLVIVLLAILLMHR